MVRVADQTLGAGIFVAVYTIADRQNIWFYHDYC